MSSRQPTYRLHKPSGQAVVTLDGRDFYLGKYGSLASKAKYDRRIEEWRHNHRRVNPGWDTTVAELVRDYMEHAAVYYTKGGKPTTEIVNIRCAITPLVRLYGETLANDFRPGCLETVRDQFIKAGNCRNTCNARTWRIVRIFKWGMGKDKVDESIWTALTGVDPLPKGRCNVPDREPVRPVSDTSVDAVKPYVSRQVWAMIELQRITGMRPGEVTIMRRRDINMKGKTWIYTPSSHKTEHHGRQRRIPLGPQARAVLEPWLRTDLDGFLFSAREAEEARQAQRRANRKPDSRKPRNRRKKNPQLQPGACYDVKSYRSAVAVACKRAGVPPWHPHQLRHNLATQVKSKIDLDAARVVLGHAKEATTRTYVDSDDIDMKKAIEVMEAVG
jgi:integrase